MALGDIIDIGGIAHVEVEASNVKNQDPSKTYAPLMSIGAIGSPSDAPWDGSSANPSVISLLKKIALNTTP